MQTVTQPQTTVERQSGMMHAMVYDDYFESAIV